MTESTKELKKLSRLELLDLLIEQSKDNDRLRTELDQARKELDERHLACDEAGNLAEAALKISKVFEAAQQAADLYLENVQSGNFK